MIPAHFDKFIFQRFPDDPLSGIIRTLDKRFRTLKKDVIGCHPMSSDITG